MKLEISYPVDNPVVTQLFGNPLPFYLKMGMKGHNGIDYRTYHGQPVYATHDGYATYQVDNSGGHGVVIITDKEYEDTEGNLSYWKSIYWHLVDPLKEPNLASPIADKTGFIKVNNGDLIGYADNTGQSTGTHLHYGIKPCAKGENNWVWFNTEQSNGYFGAVDPTPYFDGSTPVKIDLMKKQISLLKQLVEAMTKLFKK